jgi:sporulation protein YlmC with PRC-barrel domain
MKLTIYYIGSKTPDVIDCYDYRVQQSVAGMPRIEINVNNKDESLIINWDRIQKIKVNAKIIKNPE